MDVVENSIGPHAPAKAVPTELAHIAAERVDLQAVESGE
jgi:hypothetical protein